MFPSMKSKESLVASENLVALLIPAVTTSISSTEKTEKHFLIDQ